MKIIIEKPEKVLKVFVAMLLLLVAVNSQAAIEGIAGPTFNLVAGDGYVSTPDGGAIYMWGYAVQGGGIVMQYPGPTLIVNQNDTVTINLINWLPEPASIIFPGQQNVTASGDASGLLTSEAAPDGGGASYSFVASRPGTYLYQSGTNMEKQVEMGLVGTLIIRPTLGAGYAYNHIDTQFDREYLFLLSEMDPTIHDFVEQGEAIDNTTYFPVYWLINGRAFPDTMLPSGVPWLASQPYSALPLMQPGEKILCRIICASRDMHPFHQHGNHVRMIAKDGKVLASIPGTDNPDLALTLYTVPAIPGETADVIFEWTGQGLGYDIYGTGSGFQHSCNGSPVTDCTETDPAACQSAGFDPDTKEYCLDHGKPLPVSLPSLTDITFGGLYSGSPFLGHAGGVPPGEGGLNPFNAFTYPWHSHAEKELTNFDIFPGGMLTFLYIVPPGTLSPETPSP